MKINMTKNIKEDGLISHIVLGGITSAVVDQIAAEGATEEGVMCDVVLTVNGHEIDLEKFVDIWQIQVDGMIKEAAKEIVTDKLNDISWMLEDLGQRVKDEVNKRLEDWELEKNNG